MAGHKYLSSKKLNNVVNNAVNHWAVNLMMKADEMLVI